MRTYVAFTAVLLLLAVQSLFASERPPDISSGTITIKETLLTLSPRFEIAMPNGVIDVSLRNRLANTMVDYRSKYDTIDNYTFSELDFLYHFPVYSFGINLYDKVDFEEFLSNQINLQRDRYIMPYFGYNVTTNTQLITSTKFENTYTASMDNQVVLDSGRNVTQSLGAFYSTIDEGQLAPEGRKASLNISKSFGELGSSYDYTMADANLLDVLRPYDGHYMEVRLKLGYPIATAHKPLTELYSLGGYDILRGYNYKEFRGDSIIYSRVSYRIPTVVKKEALNVSLDILSWEFMGEVGKIGSKDIFNNTEDIKASAGIGFGCELTFFKVVNTKFSLSINQPFETRLPRLYFSITAVSYVGK